MEFVYGFILGIFVTAVIFLLVYKLLSKAQADKFELLVNKSLDHSTAHAQQNLSLTLSPLKEKLDDYQKSVEEIHKKDIEQSAVLRTELKHMMDLGSKMQGETSSLTSALKGDVKAQGDWGEFILERSLEISGMEKGREFVLQGEGLGLKDEDGNAFRPDAIIYLPNDSHIVIDSKVSLKSLNDQNIKDLKKSITSHIDGLSKKAYQKLDGLNTPDFVIMFMPLESIMPILFKEFPEILEYAAKKNIMLATPIGILPILKTISSLWRMEKQNKNSVEIARKAGLLYDKFVLLHEDHIRTEDLINKLQDSHRSTLNKLVEGKGNLHGRVEELKELGAKNSKQLS